MKFKTTIIAALIIFSSALKAQLPNTNMENWTIATNGSDSLIGWASDNYFSYNIHKTLNKETQQMLPGAFQGNYAVSLCAYGHMGSQNASVGVLVNGQPKLSYYITSGWANIPYVESGGGTPISYKPTFLKGYYIYNTFDSIDFASATVVLSKYDVVKKKRDTVAMGSLNLLPNSNYKQFTIQINDLMPNLSADTITTVFYSSNLLGTNTGSVLYLDSLALSTSNALDEENIISDAKIYPNPNNGKFTFERKSITDEKTKLEIIDINGKLIKTFEINPTDKKIEIDLGEVSKGSYYIKSNTHISSNKIIKQ